MTGEERAAQVLNAVMAMALGLGVLGVLGYVVVTGLPKVRTIYYGLPLEQQNVVFGFFLGSAMLVMGVGYLLRSLPAWVRQLRGQGEPVPSKASGAQ